MSKKEIQTNKAVLFLLGLSDKHKLNPKYVSDFFKTLKFFDQKIKYVTGTKFLRVSGKHLEKIPIPIPPFAISKEIVKILDNFTELEVRKKRYDYYRNQLLNFKNRAAGRAGFKPSPTAHTEK
jgi:restriction endonuclease S subunit